MAEDVAQKRPSKVFKKLPQLPPSAQTPLQHVDGHRGSDYIADAKVHKRPLLHPHIASPYSGPQQLKIIYVSTKSPFLSVVKRTEKLLHLADKRAVQSATTLVTQNRAKRRRRDGDELLEIAETVESEKKRRKLEGSSTDGAREEVVLKGTGKAIHKVLELASWFQQREEYSVQLRTGSVGAIDDITIEDDETHESGDKDDDMVLDTGQASTAEQDVVPPQPAGKPASLSEAEVPETRIRYTSVLEVAISLR